MALSSRKTGRTAINRDTLSACPRSTSPVPASPANTACCRPNGGWADGSSSLRAESTSPCTRDVRSARQPAPARRPACRPTDFRSHAGKAVAAAKPHLRYALDESAKQVSAGPRVVDHLQEARWAHPPAVQPYDDGAYATIERSYQMLHHLDPALTLMGEPDRIYEPPLNSPAPSGSAPTSPTPPPPSPPGRRPPTRGHGPLLSSQLALSTPSLLKFRTLNASAPPPVLPTLPVNHSRRSS